MAEYRSQPPALSPRRARAKLVYTIATCVAAASATMLVASCTVSERVPIVLGDDYADGSSTPAFTGLPDAAADAAATLIEYCPSDKCPLGTTTCPGSRFPCDVDFRTDRNNCGGCGLACPSSTTGRETYECVEGRCVVTCNIDYATLNCDGLPDNGCETDPNPDDCGACGYKCPDPAKPCIARAALGDIGCGCYDGKLACGVGLLAPCIDPMTNDQNCGGCGNVCPRDGDGGASLPNSYYGCIKGKCGGIKCNANNGDCDGLPENGCETSLLLREHCGACGNVCMDGQECRLTPMGVPQCMCPDSMTFCAMGYANGVGIGECMDLASDVLNCGSCGYSCRAGGGRNSVGICDNGTCRRRCVQGRADCNGNAEDECEVDTDSDPRNCGGCGKVCDAIAGQACVRGRCVVEPCNDPDAGSVGAR